jgi:hypothetical protein
MRRRSILEWTILTTISIVAVLVMFSNVRSQTQGALEVLDKDGKPNGECPLKHTDEETDTSLISPPSAPGVRAGHDISLEIDLDAGVPIVGVNSDSHETQVQQINEQRAVVRLKDRATIPNKDFLLTYRVAGPAINDAVLAHRSERGGFFTLILQPPQRVAAEDVMPKELVFVLPQL